MADEKPVAPTVVGPGSIPEARVAEFEPTLNNATRDELVEILNPMTIDFIARVGVTKQGNMPVRINNPQGLSTKTEADLAAKGIPGFRNPDLGGGKVHIANDVRIPAGQTIKQPGDVAQIIVKQLITAVISIRGNKLSIADPKTREDVEREVIINRRPMSELFGLGGPVSVEDQMQQAVEAANKGNETIFPEVTQAPLTKNGEPDKRYKGDGQPTTS